MTHHWCTHFILKQCSGRILRSVSFVKVYLLNKLMLYLMLLRRSRRFMTFYISALEILLLTYLLTYLAHNCITNVCVSFFGIFWVIEQKNFLTMAVRVVEKFVLLFGAALVPIGPSYF